MIGLIGLGQLEIRFAFSWKIAIVDKDGNFTYEIPTDLQDYGYFLVIFEVILGGLGKLDEIEAVYEHGELERSICLQT